MIPAMLQATITWTPGNKKIFEINRTCAKLPVNFQVWIQKGVLSRYASFTWIYDCRIFRILLHILAKCAYHIFFLHKLAFSIFYVFLSEAIFALISKWQRICKLNLKKLLQTALNLLNLKVIMLTGGIISVRLSQKNSCAIQIFLLTYLRSLHRIYISCLCGLHIFNDQ